MNSFSQQLKIPACYMRGGTSKGVFFKLDDLPLKAQKPGEYRDQLLLRVIGSPDPYGKQTDGMGGATSSTSKCVILSDSSQKDHHVDYLFAQVAIDKAFVDWSGNCGNLTAAVGAFAINSGLVNSEAIPQNGIAEIKIWQANIRKTIIAHIPIKDGEVQELGDFELDGVTFPAAEVKIDFIEPAAGGDLFPTGNLIDTLDIPDLGPIEATLINAGIPSIFVKAEAVGFDGTELQSDINSDTEKLALFEKIRAIGALKMGLIDRLEEAKSRQHTPKIAFAAKPKSYQSSSGKKINAKDIQLNLRALSMGQLHHAMMGTAAVAIASSAAIPGTLLNQLLTDTTQQSNQLETQLTFGHPSGKLKVGANVSNENGSWQVDSVSMSRSARRLMEGFIRVPEPPST